MEAIKSKFLSLKTNLEELQDQYEVKVTVLNELIKESTKSEIELIEKKRRIKVLEDGIDKMETKLKSNLSLIGGINKKIEENESEFNKLMETEDFYSERVENLISEVKIIDGESTVSEMKCIEVSHKLTGLEEKLKRVTLQLNQAEYHLENLNKEITDASSSLQNLELSEHQKGMKEDEYEAQLYQITKEMSRIESKNDSLERSISKVNVDIEKSKGDLVMWKQKCEDLQGEIDSVVNDVNDL